MKLWIPALLTAAVVNTAAAACPTGEIVVCSGEGATKVCWCQKPLAPGCPSMFICQT